MTNLIRNAVKGMAMGIAEVIPGVSGGTIAFITGIYEQLLHSIKAFGPSLMKTFRKEGMAGVFEAINIRFLISLAVGMAFGIVVGVFGISYLLDNYPPLVWAFFFGLIIASAIYVGRQIEKWGAGEIVLLILGTVIAYGITMLSPANGSESLGFVFIAGLIAISALILPGISGSFILLLMGMYSYIITDTLKPALRTLATDKLLTLGVFALGCITGLMTLSRVLSWTFKQYRSLTLAILTGFMLGSLNKIWPWRVAVDWLRDKSGEIVLAKDGTPKKVLIEENVMPNQFEAMTGEEAYLIGAILLVIIGFAAVFVMEKWSKK